MEEDEEEHTKGVKPQGGEIARDDLGKDLEGA